MNSIVVVRKMHLMDTKIKKEKVFCGNYFIEEKFFDLQTRSERGWIYYSR
jgi:hypothetical protein